MPRCPGFELSFRDFVISGISYEDVKGSYMGLCFAGQAEAYDFHTAPKKSL